MPKSSHETLADSVLSTLRDGLADAITQTGVGSVGDGADVSDPGAGAWVFGPLAVDPGDEVVFWVEPRSSSSVPQVGGQTSGGVARFTSDDVHELRVVTSVTCQDGDPVVTWRKATRYLEALKYVIHTKPQLGGSVGATFVDGYSSDVEPGRIDDLLFFHATLDLRIVALWGGP